MNRRARHYRCAVLGHPIRHSLSPYIHAAFAKQLRIPLSYCAIDVAPEELHRQIIDLRARGFIGVNLTVPHKQQIVEYLDAQSALVTRLGASNTLSLNAPGNNDSPIHGVNTDTGGFLLDIRKRLGWEIAGRQVLLIGAGGAASAIADGIAGESPAHLVIANRTVARAQALAQQCRETYAINCSDCALTDLPTQSDIIIHTTSGAHHEAMQWNKSIFRQTQRAYDISYGAAAWAFLKAARDAGVEQTSDGLGMLIEQAALSFAFWFGKKPLTRPLFQHLSAHHAMPTTRAG